MPTSEWFKFANVEAKKSREAYVPVPGGGNRQAWIIHFSGPREAYTPDYDTLFEARKLELPPDFYGKPTDEVIAFLKKWGPLGFIFESPHRRLRRKDITWVGERRPAGGVSLAPSQALVVDAFERNTAVSPDEVDAFLKGRAKPTVELLSAGYSEYWHWIQNELALFKRAFNELQAGNDTLINSEQAPVRYLVDLSGEKPSHRFQTDCLLDSLYNLAVQHHVGGEWRKCEECGHLFDTVATGRRTYCGERCMWNASHKGWNEDRRESPQREKNILLQRASRRRHNQLKGAKNSEEIQKIKSSFDKIEGKIKGEDDPEKLMALEKHYPELAPQRVRKSVGLD